MIVFCLFAVFATLLIIGVPVGITLLAAAITTVLMLHIPPIVVAQQLLAGVGSPTLVAIPLFIFAGELMLRGGISDRLIGFASSLVGHLRGGLAQISIVASLLFGGVSGSALADVSAIGGTMIPQMVKRGYDRDFAVNVSIAAALVALLVPPSHNLILYSASVGGAVSIIDLFSAGIIPALMTTAALMLVTRWMAVKRGYAPDVFPGWKIVISRFASAVPGLLLVALIFVGIRAGIFTAVESASVAVIYALLVTVFIYRQQSLHSFIATCKAAAKTTGLILFVIGAASACGWLMAYLQIPAATVEWLRSVASERWAILLLINVVLLILGAFMDLAPLILIATPIFLPVAKAFGVDPVHFGIILIMNAGHGLVTPPLGSVLFLGTAIGKISVNEVMRSIWPFYLAEITVLMLVTYIPALSLWLPSVLK
jgi:tripartite ATP-independent transporter DctM subunit